MRRAFGDSFFFIALLNQRDAWHQQAIAMARDWQGQIVTTRWILAETGNALSSPAARPAFLGFIGRATAADHGATGLRHAF